METQLNVIPADLADVLPLLEMAGSGKADTTMGAASVREMCQGAMAFAVQANGQCCMAYTMKLVDHENSRVAWVMAAGGQMDGVDLTATLIPVIELQAKTMGADQVAITTRRRGLIHKLDAMGFSVAGITLRKKL